MGITGDQSIDERKILKMSVGQLGDMD